MSADTARCQTPPVRCKLNFTKRLLFLSIFVSKGAPSHVCTQIRPASRNFIETLPARSCVFSARGSSRTGGPVVPPHQNTSDCGRSAKTNETPLASLGLDAQELICLDIARLFFNSFSVPGRHEWIRAFEVAEFGFDQREGPEIAMLVMKLLRAIRGSRKSVFMYSNRDCPCCRVIATEHERRFISALSQARRGHEKRAQLEMMLLCEGNETEEVMAWLRELSLALPSLSHVPQRLHS
ncbi:MAG: hypothetical protein OXC60_14460 [Litoreibacter sp.]|nr:hypothetical protein [Litoreibacter sp.]